MAVDTLNNAIAGFPKYEHTLPNELVCAAATEDCWFKQCPNCKDDGKLCKIVKEGTSDDLFSHLCAILPEFLQHSYTKRNQAESYHNEREAVSGDFDQSFAMPQVDFSENYTCMFQDEIQRAHWKQDQVSLFTAVLWFDGKLHPKVITSDNLDHGKDTIVTYIYHLQNILPNTVETISIWSDGPLSQFKNRFIVAVISALQEKHKVIEMKSKEIEERNVELNLEEVSDKAPAIKVTPFLSSESESAVDSNNHNIDNHNNYSTNTNIEASNNQTNACTLSNTIAKTYEINPIENEATISHPQILVEDSMTVALMADIMKDDDTDMETDITDPTTERKLLGPEDDNINTYTNNETQNSSDSTGLEGLTQKSPEITHKLHSSKALNNNNLDTNRIRDIINMALFRVQNVIL
ncbi:Hypothetical predicted protein [Paramuricea clavata]|uniref:Uncharacterized protein n=1 Tax=Paramuricea clavata TaxID=317549 RepID=A0A7D9D7Q9_PARCT|nr:Hypothetical predicted protein [Paramuricea clavata]